ncbi:glycosyl transferase [Nocardioides luteus]|uniref:Glycosyl transferase n=2 Tax=Nocardioides luteus TaxID=1844 RepID=A0A1J4N1A1_9ACTN|nr:glycosyl transferase [Nocardioides luteus]
MTRNRWPDLRRSLPRHPAPVILVDNCSSDGTAALVRRHFPDIEVVELAANAGAAARNVGVRRARTPYVAFADDDSWWAPGSLESAAALFRSHPRLGLVAGRVLVGEAETPDPLCTSMATSPLGTDADLPGPSVLGFLACGAVVRRDAFLEADGFDTVVFFMGEEDRLALDLASRGWGLSYVDSLVACHHPSPARDATARRALDARNKLLTAVMRRPWSVVMGEVTRLYSSDRAGRIALRHALPRLPHALARRRRLPARVEAARRLLETNEEPWG